MESISTNTKGIRALKEEINSIKRSNIQKTINRREKEFDTLGNLDDNEIFKELCFCLLTANFTADKSIKIQKEIDNGFLTLPQDELAKKLKSLGHRFPNTRSKYIVEARKYKDNIKEHLNKSREAETREWLVKNIKGLGYKEASHFLRNIGFKDVSIIDFHIIDLLVDNGIIKRPKTITKRVYLDIEKKLKTLAREVNLNLSELDLYLWYIETGKVLK